ncbi:MAG: alpha/beta hydrolase [Clostridiales bacterium]|nr:alpha/beta hydrolase [Clostridiales bacterium]
MAFSLPTISLRENPRGKYVGFDYFESQDLLEWIKFLESKFGKDTKFILHGISMGAATVMMLCADKCPKSVKLIIEDCGYTCAKDQFEYLIKKAGIKKPETIYNSFNYFNKKIAGYNLSLTDVRNQVKNTKVPILFIHGDKDDFVPFEMVYELYNICPENKRTIKVIHNATHANSAVVDEKEYFDALTDFYYCAQSLSKS